ncbi:Disease resistance protein RPM1, partial [Mucuna pruriens]
MLYVKQQPREPGCAALLSKIIRFIETLMPHRRIASEIQKIKSDVDEIMQRGKNYNFLNQPAFSQSVQRHDPRPDSRFLKEDEVVGFEGPRNKLIGWLVEGPAERSVISVVGMGGLGKTTLVGKVFNNLKVRAHFNSHAWITVSQSYTVDDLMRKLLTKLCKEEQKEPPQHISEMDRDSLIDEVREHFQQNRYVVIFDDVWSAKLWGEVEPAMHDNNNGSRILITTRSMNVADSCRNSPSDKVHELKPLSFEKSMELFCKKAFRCDNNGCCPEDLVIISSEFVEKCNGLPLAIVAIGGLLSCKEKTPFEWEKIKRSLKWKEMDINLNTILGFSYDDLPNYLKPCLLYFGIYPEDYEIESRRLVCQWIAEGFVKDEEGKSLEDVAQQYLTELVGRSLVQVSSFTIDDKVETCHVHDVLRDMILEKFMDLNFCLHISKENELVSSGMIRRLSITTNSNDLLGSIESSHIRSLFVFTSEESRLSNEFVQRIPTKYRLLKVLHFEDGGWDFVPGNWENLAHLRYLNLVGSPTTIENLLKCIGKLQNLETLNIGCSDFKKIPKEICKITKLRHLLGDGLELFELKNSLGGMTSLQTLHCVKLTEDDDNVELIRELGKLKQLRILYLTGVKERLGSSLCTSINQMQSLEELEIEATSEDAIDLPDISSLPMLRYLELSGKLNKIPQWVPQLQNLVILHLFFSRLSDEPLQSLQNMPHLLCLRIAHDAYKGESLYFQAGGFRRLKELSLQALVNLNSIIIDKGALRSLKTLAFSSLDSLNTIPSGMQHLENLEDFGVGYMPDEFVQCIAPDGGPKHPSIHHVPLVQIFPQRRILKVALSTMTLYLLVSGLMFWSLQKKNVKLSGFNK